MNLGTAACLAALVCACAADKWKWPEQTAASVRIDTKVRFFDDATDNDHKNKHNEQLVQADEPQFDKQGPEEFYNRPPAGRYPVRSEAHRAPYRVDSHAIYSTKKSPQFYSDGTLDSLQYCKCVSTPECNPSVDSTKACGLGKFLCCYARPNKHAHQNTEYFNEVEDERPVLLPGQGERAGPFPYAPGAAYDLYGPGQSFNRQGSKKPVLVGPDGPTGIIGPAQKQGVLVGPDGPTGIIGPDQNRGVFRGPEGPAGIIGIDQNRGVLTGPGGPTGIIGPGQNRGGLNGPEGPAGIHGQHQNRGVLVGPGGPTGIVGPGPDNKDAYLANGQAESESAQRGVLVGPGGPTGIIGPAGYGGRPVLVGPGGPTGIIGPYGRRNPAVLVGPGGPTGMIGPPRRRPYYYGK